MNHLVYGSENVKILCIVVGKAHYIPIVHRKDNKNITRTENTWFHQYFIPNYVINANLPTTPKPYSYSLGYFNGNDSLIERTTVIIYLTAMCSLLYSILSFF